MKVRGKRADVCVVDGREEFRAGLRVRRSRSVKNDVITGSIGKSKKKGRRNIMGGLTLGANLSGGWNVTSTSDRKC